MIIPLMARILVAVFLFVLASSNSRAEAPASIEVLQPSRTYPSEAPCELRKVDFRNFTYFTGEWMGASNQRPPDGPVHVSHGKYSLREQGGFDDVSVEAVLHPTIATVVVSLLHSYGGGSSNQELVVLLFKCVDGKLTNTQLIHGDGHGSGTGVIFSDQGQKMTMNSVDDYTNGHCCPRYLETAVFSMKDAAFVLVATRRKEIDYPR
jgi:hypothetical protein